MERFKVLINNTSLSLSLCTFDETIPGICTYPSLFKHTHYFNFPDFYTRKKKQTSGDNAVN